MKELIDSAPHGVWLDDAQVEIGADGREILRVRGDFQKTVLERRYGDEVRRVFGNRIEIRVRPPRPGQRPNTPGAGARARALLAGPRSDTAVRMVRGFVEDGWAAGPLLVLCGPPGSGKSLLVDWACERGGSRVFRLDLPRLRQGGSRWLEPRKPMVVIDGVDQLAGAPGAQRTLIRILDGVRDRGQRALVTLRGSGRGPEAAADLDTGLLNRLRGGVWVNLDPPGCAAVRSTLQAHARRLGLALDPRWEDELSLLPPEEAVHVLDARLRERSGAGGTAPWEDRIRRMKDVAAQLLEVDRSRLDGGCRRRSSVEARRVVIVAALRAGCDERLLAAAFGLRGVRPVREALRSVEREERRDPRYPALVDEVARVAPGT